MSGLENNPKFWALIIAVLFGMFFFSLGVVILRRLFINKINMEYRLKKVFNAQGRIKKEKNKKVGFMGTGQLIKRSRLFDVMKDELVLAGLMMKPEEVIVIWLFSIFIPSGIAAVSGVGLVPALMLIVFGLFLPPWFIERNKAKHIVRFEAQLSDALDIISNCLRSGLTFHQALESIANEMSDPIAREFKRVLREIQFGSTIEDSLNNLTKRIKSKDLLLVVSAILIQRQVGGNLSQLLNNISGTIKERIKLKQDIKVMTTTGRMSGIVIGLLPVVVFALLFLMNPNYVLFFFTEKIGLFMITSAAVMETLGFIVVRKIVSVKY